LLSLVCYFTVYEIISLFSIIFSKYLGSNIGTVRPLSGGVSAATPYPLSPQSSYSGDTIKPEHFKMSLVSAVHEKACDRFFELTSVKQAEIDSLNRVNTELEESQRHLESFSSEVENEILNLNNMTIELNDKTSQLNESINQMQHRDSASIEDAVVTPAPLYRQLMQLFAEELAIQDLIYYLSEGLQNRTVNLPDFLKQVRFLSRKQFMLRATMQRAREKAALPL
jgi:ESCRT-I complex subunit TSG101